MPLHPLYLNFKRSVSRALKKLGNSRGEDSILLSSSFFDHAWYLETYPDVATNKDWRKRPHAHYLRFGAKEGRDPSPFFKTRWYLKQNPDVAQRGVNPLVHYIRFGAAEGRLPAPSTWANSASHGVQAAEFWSQRLWGGFSKQALVELKRQSDDADVVTQRFARWYLARWEYAHGRIEEALLWLDLADRAEAKLQPSMQTIIGRARCYIQQNNTAGLHQQIEKTIKGINAELDPVLHSQLPFLYLSDTSRSSSERLSALNELYTDVGLQTLAVETGAEFNLSGLKGSVEVEAVNEGPLVSVVIPAYNAAATLSIALESLLAQSWRNLEVLVVDDCSDDETVELVERFMALDSRVRLLRNEQNKGAYPSRNRGVEAAKGDFVTVHDSDDWSHPDKIKVHVEALLRNDNAKASVSQWVRTLADLRLVGSWYLNHEFLEKNHSSSMFRKEVIDTLGYWDEVNVAGDTEYLWRVNKVFGDEAIYEVLDGVPLSFALEHENSLTRHSSTHVKTIHYGLRKLYRDAAKSWHERASKLYLPPGGERVFAAPWGNVRGQAKDYDAIVVGNLSAMNNRLPNVLATLERYIKETGNSRLAFFHYPSLRLDISSPIADSVLVFALHYGIPFVHDGVELDASTIIVLNLDIFEYQLDGLPVVSGVKDIFEINKDGNLTEVNNDAESFELLENSGFRL